MKTDVQITELGVRWRDPTFQVRTRPQWLNYLNKAHRKFIKRAKFPMDTGFTDIPFAAGVASADLPAGAWGVQSVLNKTTGTALNWMPNRDVQAALFGAGTATGDTTHFTIEGRKLYLLSPPRTAITVRVLTETALVDLVDSNASESPLPDHYHHALLDGAMELACRDDQNPELSEVYAKDFNEAISDALREFTKPRGGRNVQRRNDYFETGVHPLARGR